MSRLPWIRVYTELLHDPKIRRLSTVHKWVWVGLMLMAGESPERGKLYIAEGIPFTEDDIAAALELDPMDDEWKEVNPALDRFKELKMIEIDPDGTIIILNFEKRQYDHPSDTPAAIAERVKRHREKKCNENVTTCNALDTDTDTDTDTDKTLLSEVKDDSDKTVAKKVYEKEFEEILWPEIWKKETRADTLRLVTSLRKHGVSLATLLAGIKEYCREKESEGAELQFYMQPKKFFGRGEHWKEYAEKAEERESRRAVAKEAEVVRQERVEKERKPPPTPEEMAKAKEQADKFKEQARQIANARSIE